MPSNAVLNLTDRQVVAMSEAAKARAPQSTFTPLRVTGGSVANAYGTPGGPQWRQADAPPPLRGSYRGAVNGAQSGGWRGNPRARGGGLGSTANGYQNQQQSMPTHTRGNMNGGSVPFQPRGGRGGQNGYTNAGYRGGRGGAPNRQGFTVIDNSDPTEGVVNNNPSFRPKNYSNVPPPAGLDANSGRGRGSRGGRGSTRGRGDGNGRGQGGVATT